MTEKIISRTIKQGNEKESSWPSQFGEGRRGVFHVKKGEVKEGYPEPETEKLGKAPMYISDTCKPFYHQGAMRWTDSKSKIKMYDQACGTITTDKYIAGNPDRKKQLHAQRRKDIRESIQKAVGQIDAGNSPLNEEQRALCARTNEIISNATGIDAYNAMGRVSNAKGKRYKRKLKF